MNVFYVEPAKVFSNHLELTGQEAKHAIKVLRIRIGDELHATDGEGKQFLGKVSSIGKDSVSAHITQTKEIEKPKPELILAMGIIKKRDRLEFAVEKAVELGASEIVLFDADHSEKNKVREDRLQNIVLSALKQSMRAWLPKISVLNSIEEVLAAYSNAEVLMAHEKVNRTLNTEQGTSKNEVNSADRKLLLVGPEGGFSNREVEMVQQKNGQLVSLGDYRLRAETAVVAFLSRFIQ